MSSPVSGVLSSREEAPSEGTPAALVYRFCRAVGWVGVGLSTASCAAFIFYSIYSGFRRYDDEGGFLILLRALLQGRVLYDQVVAMYGPVALLGKWALLTALRLPATHDVGRAITGSLWLATVVTCGAAVWRWTRQPVAFVLGVTAATLLLQPIVREPSHPQDLCGFFVALSLVCATGTMGPGRVAALIGVGVLGGLLAMTKINLGIFFAAAWFGALLANQRLSGGRSLVWNGYCLLLLLLPVALMGPHLSEPAVFYFAFQVECGLVALLLFFQPDEARIGLWQCLLAVVSLPATVIAVCALTILHGTSVRGLAAGLVNQPLHVVKFFYMWPTGGPQQILLGGASLVLAYGAKRALRNPASRRQQWVPFLRIAIALAVVSQAVLGQRASLFEWAPSCCWILLAVRGPSNKTGSTFCRHFLVLLATLETLWAYPVAGTQTAFSLLLPMLIAIITLVEQVHALLPAAGRLGGLWVGFATTLILVCVLSDAILAEAASGRYRRLVSLSLPGARLVHVSTSERDALHRVVDNLNANAHLVLNLPGLNSFYLWTGQPTPTDCNTSTWITLTAAQARAAARATLSDPNGCVFFDEQQAKFWNREVSNTEQTAFLRLLRSNYKPAIAHDSWTLFVPLSRRTAVCVAGDSTRRQVLLNQPVGFARDTDQPSRLIPAPASWLGW